MSVTMIDIEHYLAGTLDPSRMRAIEELAEQDAALKSLLEERRALEARLKLDPRVKPFVALLEERPARVRWPQWIGAFAAAAAAALFFVVFRPPEPKIGVRGGVAVQAVRLRDEKTESVESGSALRAGDRLQIYVDDPLGGHAVVLWADERGHAEVLHQLVATPPVTRLPTSFEVDGDVGREAIYVVLCKTPPDIRRWPEELAETYDAEWIPPDGCRAGMFAWRIE